MTETQAFLADRHSRPRSAPRQLPTKRAAVDFWENRADHDCALFASMGFSTRYIQKRTDLSPSQITYRIRKAGLIRANSASRTDFRNGTSPYAQAFLRIGAKVIERDLMRYLKNHL